MLHGAYAGEPEARRINFSTLANDGRAPYIILALLPRLGHLFWSPINDKTSSRGICFFALSQVMSLDSPEVPLEHCRDLLAVSALISLHCEEVVDEDLRCRLVPLRARRG